MPRTPLLQRDSKASFVGKLTARVIRLTATGRGRGRMETVCGGQTEVMNLSHECSTNGKRKKTDRMKVDWQGRREKERGTEIFTLTKFTVRILSKNSFRRKDAIQETHNEGSEGGVYVVNYCALINSCLEELRKNCPSRENLVEARVRCFLSTVETRKRKRGIAREEAKS